MQQSRGYRQAVARLRRGAEPVALPNGYRLAVVVLPLFLLGAALVGGYVEWNRVSGDPTGKCGYYGNSRGYMVPRPCGNWWLNPTPPAGATAKCRDGTWTWSRRPEAAGTCSHHFGVYSRL